MAKKKDEKNEIEYNDDDSLSDLDIPELDLGVDPGSDSRSPTERLSSGFVQGVKTDLTDQRKLGSRLKELMPEEYNYGFNAVEQTAGAAGELYNTVRNETKDGVKSFKKLASGYVDKVDGKLPKSITDRLKAFTEVREGYKSPSVGQQRDDQVTNTLASIFEAQSEGDAEARAEEKSERALNSVMEQYRHQDQLTLLQGLREDVARQVNYQDQIAAKWQRKSLELQYRQLFVGRDLLQLTETGVKDTKEALREIVKNTSLPDYRKIELTEAVGQNFRDRILNSFGTDKGSFWDQLKTNTFEKVKGLAGSANNAMVSAADFQSQMDDLGGDIDGVSEGGKMAGGSLAGKALSKLLGQGRNALSQNDDIVRRGVDIENALRGSQYELQERALNGELIPNWLPFSAPLNQVVQDVMPDMRQSNALNEGTGIQDAMAPAVFDVLTRRSIVDIIPGYLSRIHEEMRTIRQSGGLGGEGTSDGGVPPQGPSPQGGGRLEYDIHTGEFKEVDDVKESIKKNILKTKDAAQVRDRINVIIDAIDPSGELSMAARQGVGLHAMERVREGKNFDPVDMAQGNISQNVDPEIRDQISQFLTERLGVTEEVNDKGESVVKREESLENSETINKLGRQFEQLKKEMPDPVQQIQAYFELGLKTHLEELGIAKRNEDGSLVFDSNAYHQGIQSGGWGEKLTEEDQLRLAEQDSVRRVETWQKQEEDRERAERFKQQSKEAYDASLLGRTQKQVTDKLGKVIDPVKDALMVQGRKAAKTTEQFYKEQSARISEIARSDDPKAAAKAYVREQTQLIQEKAKKGEISPQAAREYLVKQTAVIKALMKNKDLNPDFIDEPLEDVRDELEKEAIRQGEIPGNIPPGIEFAASGIEGRETPDNEVAPAGDTSTQSVIADQNEAAAEEDTSKGKLANLGNRAKQGLGQLTEAAGDLVGKTTSLRGRNLSFDSIEGGFSQVDVPSETGNVPFASIQPVTGQPGLTLADARRLAEQGVGVANQKINESRKAFEAGREGKGTEEDASPSIANQAGGWFEQGLGYVNEQTQKASQSELGQKFNSFMQTNPGVSWLSNKKKDVTEQVGGQLATARSYLEGLREEGAVGEEYDKQIKDLKEFISRSENFLREQVEGAEEDDTQLDLILKQTKAIQNSVMGQVNSIRTETLAKIRRDEPDSQIARDFARIELPDDSSVSQSSEGSVPRDDSEIRNILTAFMEESKLGRQELIGALGDIKALLNDSEEGGTDTDRIVEAIESTVDPEYQDSHLMLLTRIIETLEAQAISPDDTEEKRSLVKRMMSKTGSLLGSTGRGLARFYGGTFAGIGMGIQGAGRLARGVGGGVGGFIGNTMTGLGAKVKQRRAADVYLKGATFPSLRAVKMRKGLYFDKETNEVIKSIGDIRDVQGDIMEIDEEDPEKVTIALSLADMEDGLYDWTGKPLFSGNFFQGIKNLIGKGAGALGDFYSTVYGKPLKMALGAAKWTKDKVKEKLNRPTDVYVAGEEFPRMRAIIMERGGYFDAESGEVIDHQDKIRGPVKDARGLEVISSVDIQTGLVDATGHPIGKGKIGKYAAKAIMAPVKAAKWGFDKSMELLQWGGNALKGIFQGITGIFQRDNGITEETGREQVDILTEIRNILDERLEKRDRFDTDEDGYRDGSWRERFAEDEEEDTTQEGEREGQGESSSGLLGTLLGAGAGGLSALKDKLFGGDDEENGEGGSMAGKLFENATNAMATAWAGARAWAGTKAAALGGGRLLAALGGSKIAAGLAGLVALPVLAKVAIGAAVVGTGYLAYRAFFKDEEPGPLTNLRMLQYGFREGNQDAIAKTLYLEETVRPHTRVTTNGAQIDFESLDLNTMAKECGVNIDNDMEVRAFTRWFAGRFYPVYLTHFGAVKQFGNTYSLDQVDKRLNNEEKAQYLSQVKDMSQFDVHPYTVTNYPFDSRETIRVTPEDIQAAFNSISVEVEKGNEERSESRASSSVLGGDFSAQNLSNVANPDALDDWEEQDTQAPDVARMGKFQETPVKLAGDPLDLTASEGTKVVNALDAVRYRTYGLKTLDSSKISALLKLEEDVREYISYKESIRAEFEGDVDRIASRNYTRFGLMLHHRRERRLWKEWFEYRFLPVYLRFLSGLLRISSNYETAVVDISRHPKTALEIARWMASTRVIVGDEDTFVWMVPSSPWPNYELNYDSNSIQPNLDALERKVPEKEVGEEEASGEADKQDSDTLPEVTPPKDDLSSLETRMRQLTNIGGGSSNAADLSGEGESGDLSSTSSGSQSQLVGSTAAHTRASVPRNEGYNAVLREMGKQGITDPEEQAMVLAQMAHESGDFTQVEENLNYGVPALLDTFSKYFSTRAEAERFARKPEPIANRAYGGRMGNTEPGDGFKYRGRGFIQLTGKDNYTAASRALGVDYVNNPDLVAEPEHAARVSLWWWRNRSGLSQAGQRGDVNAATKLINGGYNGIQDRRRKFQKYLPMARSGELQEDIVAATNEASSQDTPQVSEQAIASATQVGDTPTTTESSADTQVADAGNRTPTQVQEEVENKRQANTVSFANGSRQQAGQLTTASFSTPSTAANDEQVAETSDQPENEETDTSTPVNSVANAWTQDTPGKPATLRQQVASTTYVGSEATPDARAVLDEQRVAERRQRESVLAAQREERTANNQQASAEALQEIISLTQESVRHQRNMDTNIEALLNETRQQNSRPSAQPVPADHRQDSTHDDIVAAARREGRQRPSELGKGVVDVSRKRYA